jgi:aryl-alcohol dehydrogenase-like predicted oxidoreductase
MGVDPNQQGASRRWIITAVENSLRRLQTGSAEVAVPHERSPNVSVTCVGTVTDVRCH